MQYHARHLGRLLALVLIVVVPGERAAGTVSQAQYHGGKFLVATTELRDPRFVQSVVYMIHHDASGAMGLVINRPMGEMSLAELLKGAGLDSTGIKGSVGVHYGGPVQAGRGFVLHSTDYQGDGTRTVGQGIALTTDARILQAIGSGKGPRQYLVAVGYAGWGPGQLEREISSGAWEVVPADAGLLFDDDAATKWERAMARRMIIL